jgi:8-oxo-dGTP pyrophosphatase MutT (NUDIX family)
MSTPMTTASVSMMEITSPAFPDGPLPSLGVSADAVPAASGRTGKYRVVTVCDLVPGEQLRRADRVVAPFSHCAYCGHRFADQDGWPRRCGSCGNVSYRNPIPVVVLAVPVEDLGLLMVRRVEPPAGIALPSGYIEVGETWQDAAARELEEETAVRVDPASIRELNVRSGDDGTLLVFATVPPIDRVQLDAFSPSAEVSELAIVSAPRDDVVFPLDAAVVATFQAS